jgi:integrase
MTGTPTKYRGIVKLGTNRHLIRLRATDPRTGKRKAVVREVECTLTEARARQLRWRDELFEDLRAPEKAERVRLKDFVSSWLASRITAGELKQSSADKIALVWDLHIVATDLAHLYIDDIGEEDVRRWLDDLRAKQYVPGKGKTERRKTRSDKSEPRAYSRATIRGYYRVLRTILVAAGAGHACNVGRLKGGKRKPNYLKPTELAAVLSHVRAKAPEWYPAVLLDAFAGLRWGELSALKWEDVDEEAGVIRVRRGNYKGRVVDSTKTGDDEDPNEKHVPLLPAVAEVLRARRQRMIADQHPGLSEGWIFPNTKGRLYKGSPLRDVLDAACAAAGARRITTHGLRHTANDLLRRVADGDTVRAIIGHATEQMTHHYSHVDETDKRTAIQRAFEVVTGGAPAAKGTERVVGRVVGAESKSAEAGEATGILGGATQI